jgi:hypothetical protein
MSDTYVRGERPKSGRPSDWRRIDGEIPKLCAVRMPLIISGPIKTIAMLLDQEDPELLAFIKKRKSCQMRGMSIE